MNIIKGKSKNTEDKTLKRVVMSLVKKLVFIVFIISFLFPCKSAFSDENTVSAILTAKVTTTYNEHSRPIGNAQIIVINSLGKIIGTELTNAEGIAKIPITIHKDTRFPMKNMGEVTIITVANRYNEHINFSVPINEFNDNTARVFIPLWKIDPNRRNEPQFLHGSFHRFTVFKMLECYADKLGLKRQEVTVDIGSEPPWRAKLNGE